MQRTIIKLSILALLISFFLEITLFNYTHYAALFTSEHFGIAYNEQEQDFVSNIKEYLLEGIAVQDSFLLPKQLSGLKFKNLNTEIASIYIDPVFLWRNRQNVRIIWADEESSERYIDVGIIKGLSFSNYININPRGKVSNLTIVFLENNIAIKSIELNKEIPMAIMPIRLLIVFAAMLLLLCLRNIELRKKISWFCFDYLYDKTNCRQSIGFATLIFSMLVFNFLVSYSNFGFRDNEFSAEWAKMYSHHMTDALLKRQLHLDIEVPKALLEAEKPYDNEYREKHGMILSWNFSKFDSAKIALLGDRTLYKGKYYSYYGILPVIILYAPYKLITGNYLPSTMGNFLFASMATIMLMLLWRQIAQNYLKKIPYFFFLISGASLYACSLIPTILAEARFASITQFSALFFVLLGVYLLLKKSNMLILLLCSFCFAFAIACRPSALFWSLLIPVLLWDKREEILNVKCLSAIIIPFAIVGSMLAWYNYVRFDSPFVLGTAYMITDANQAMLSQINIIGKTYSTIKTFLFVLFNPPNLNITFPFISPQISTVPLAKSLFMYDKEVIIGIFCFPVMWFLFYIRKINILRNFILAGIFISLLNMIISSSVGGIVWRYSMDFVWIITISALICAFQFQERELAIRKYILKSFYLCCAFTLLLSFFSTISYKLVDGLLDLKIWHYLARTFGVICNVP
jgi:hypothetical protein